MKLRIEHISGLGYFVDVWIGDGWKNDRVFKTRLEAEQYTKKIMVTK